jgi:hypothetical protein
MKAIAKFLVSIPKDIKLKLLKKSKDEGFTSFNAYLAHHLMKVVKKGTWE